MIYMMDTFRSRPHPVVLLASGKDILFFCCYFSFLCVFMSLSHSLFLFPSHGLSLSLLGINWVNEQVHKSLWRLCQTEASPALNKFAKVAKSLVVACVRALCDKLHTWGAQSSRKMLISPPISSQVERCVYYKSEGNKLVEHGGIN